MSVSADDLRRLALLARVGIREARVPEMVAELNRILMHMDVLQGADVGTVAAMDVATDAMRLREDANVPVRLNAERHTFAPAFRDGFFLVPRLDSHGDAAVSADESDL